MNSAYNQIVSAASNYDRVGLQTIYSNLIAEKMKMDKFFSMYLDKFERKMDSETPNTPIWDLYKKKLKEYSELDRTIKAAQYYTNKLKHV